MLPQSHLEISAPVLDDALVREINTLIIANAGSADVMLAAASEVEDAQVQSLFESIALTRQAQASSLAALVDTEDRDAPDHGGLADTLRAYWITLHGALTDGAPEKILNDALPAEQKIEAAYRAALECQWPPPVNMLLRQQLAVINAQGQRVIQLHAQHAAS